MSEYNARHCLSSEHFLYTPLNESHRNIYTRLYRNAEVMRHIASIDSEDQTDIWFDRIIDKMVESRPSYFAWVITSRESADQPGIIGLSLSTQTPDEAEIGMLLLPQAQGQGIATEAMAAIMDHGVSRMDLKAITASHRKEHLAARNLVVRLGYCRLNGPESHADDYDFWVWKG